MTAPGTAGSGVADRLLAPLAIAVAFLAGMQTNVIYGITPTILICLGLLPVWIGVVRRSWGGLALMGLGAATIVWGIALSTANSSTHTIVTRSRFTDTFLLVGILVGIGALAWARTVISLRSLGVLFGLGVLAQEFMTSSPGAVSNPIKHFWIFPIAIIALSLSSAARRGWADVVVLAGLAAVCAFSDSRSYAASFLLAMLVRLWQLRPRVSSRRSSLLLTSGFLAAMIAAVYWLIQSLLVGGYLGEQAKIRTDAQLQATGSLILGGRPEIAGTFALMRNDFWGHGVGVLPNATDQLVLKTGMAAINYKVNNNGYVDRYMLGNGFELHSMFGDMWSRWGIAGLVLLAFIVVLLVRGLLLAVGQRRASGLLLFLGFWELWNTFFSPLLSAYPTTLLVIALVLAATRRGSEASPLPGPEVGVRARDGRASGC